MFDTSDFDNSEIETQVRMLAHNWLGSNLYKLKVRRQIRKPYMEWFYSAEIESGGESYLTVLGPVWGETREEALQVLKEQLLHRLAVRAQQENG